MSTNLNNAVPSAPAGYTNVSWQQDGAGNVSACVPTAILSDQNTFITSLTAGDVLVWNGFDWTNSPLPASTFFDVNGIATLSQTLLNFQSGSNINVSNPSAGNVSIAFSGVLPHTFSPIFDEFLTGYSASTGLFTAAQPTLAGLSDVFLTSLVAGDVLVWNGSYWIDSPLPASTSFDVNGSPTSSQTLINFQSGSNITVGNPSVGNVSISFSGQLAQTKAAVTHNFVTSYTASTGLFTLAQPSAADLSDTATSGNVLRGNGASFVSAQLGYGDLSGAPQLAQTKAAITSNWLNSYTASTGVFTASQPTFADLSSHPTTLSGYGITDANKWASLTGDLTETQVIPFDGGTLGTPDSGISRIAAAGLAIGNGSAGDYSGSLKLNSLIAGNSSVLAYLEPLPTATTTVMALYLAQTTPGKDNYNVAGSSTSTAINSPTGGTVYLQTNAGVTGVLFSLSGSNIAISDQLSGAPTPVPGLINVVSTGSAGPLLTLTSSQTGGANTLFSCQNTSSTSEARFTLLNNLNVTTYMQSSGSSYVGGGNLTYFGAYGTSYLAGLVFQTNGDTSVGTYTTPINFQIGGYDALFQFSINSTNLNLNTGIVLGWGASDTNDTGISRLAADSLAIGNGTQGGFSGSLKLTGLNVQGHISETADVAGQVTITASNTTQAVTFSTAYLGTGQPIVLLTPTSDPLALGVPVGYWVTYQGSAGNGWTGFTANIQAALVGNVTFNYCVFQNR